MNRSLAEVLAIAVLFLAGNQVVAHPGSGIVVDTHGNVYFVDTGSGVWKIDTKGALTKLSAPAYHWMSLDVTNRLSSVTLPSFSHDGATLTRASDDSRIIVSSDFPITVAPDGSLFYPLYRDGGPLRLYRLLPSGSTSAFAAISENTEGTPLRWLNGLAAAPDGSIYFTEDRAVRKISPAGDLTTIISLSDCDSAASVWSELGPNFRGLDVDSNGNVYLAAPGCRSVLKLTADGTATTILRATSPWAPTGLAVSGADLYVLEYLHTPGDDRREWLPRVRKVSPDGTVATIAAIDRR